MKGCSTSAKILRSIFVRIRSRTEKKRRTMLFKSLEQKLEIVDFFAGPQLILDKDKLVSLLYVQGQARGYGHITSFACRPHGASTSNLNNLTNGSIFLKASFCMKIWDICDCLQLVLRIFIKSSSNESILKKSFQQFVFSTT